MKEFVDDSDFQKGIEYLEKHAPKMMELAVGRAALALLNDAQTKAPKPPVATGFLRGAWGVYVNGKNQQQGTGRQIRTNLKTESGSSRKAKTQTLDMPGSISSIAPDAHVVFNTPYATKMHQAWKPPGGFYSQQDGNVGRYFLSSKAQKYAMKYGDIMAQAIAKYLNNLKKP